MKGYIIKRILQLLPMLLGITLLSFALMRLAGSDAVLQKYDQAGMVVSQAVIDAERARLGLDQPFVTQYVTWLGQLLTGNMGTSFVSGQPIFTTFMSKLPATLLLTVSSLVMTIVISIPLGIAAAVYQNKPVDYVIRFCSFCGNSMPNFFTALVLLYFLSIRFGLFPVISQGITVRPCRRVP